MSRNEYDDIVRQMTRPEPPEGFFYEDAPLGTEPKLKLPAPPPGFVRDDDPYRETLDRLAKRQEVGLRISAMQAAEKDPNRQAEVLRLSQRTGLPASLIDRNFDDIRKRSEIVDTDYAKMLRESPKLAEWLSDAD